MQDQTPYTNTPEPTSPLKVRRRSHHILGKFIALVVAILIGVLLGIFGYRYLTNITASTKSNTPNTGILSPSKTSQLPDANALISALQPKLTGTVVPVTINTSTGMAQTSDGFGAYSVPAYKPSGAQFYTTPRTYSGVTVAVETDNNLVSNFQSATSYLDKEKLVVSGENIDSNGLMSANFYSPTVLCNLTETSFNVKSGTKQLNVGCADMSDYQAAANVLKPLYDAQLAQDSHFASTTGVVFQGESIKPSKTSGYQIATVNTGNIFTPAGGSLGLFYQTPDKAWHYFTSTQSTLNCDSYSTPTLKKAYLGEDCANSSTGQLTTVKL